jgi:hypothetical protein
MLVDRQVTESHHHVMQSRPYLVERAFQLAQAGDCKSVDEIRRQLEKERYDSVRPHLAGRLIIEQLRAEIRRARSRK